MAICSINYVLAVFLYQFADIWIKPENQCFKNIKTFYSTSKLLKMSVCFVAQILFEGEFYTLHC